MLVDYVRLAVSSLSKRKTRTYLTMIGIFIGIAAVVALIGLGEGLRGAITGQFGFLGPDVLTVTASGLNFAGPPGQGVVNPLTEDVGEEIERINGVDSVIFRYIESGTVEFNDEQDVIFAWNIPEGKKRKTFETMVNLKVSEGRLLRDEDRFKVLLGSDFTDENMFGKQIFLGDEILFQDKSFEVVGFIEKKGSFIFDSAFVMNEEILTDTFRDDDSVNTFAVKVKNIEDVDEVKENVEQFLRKERDVKKGEEDFTVQTAQSALQSLDSTLFAVNLFVIVIALISVLVGSIGISNTMYTSVLERTKEIGIMKSLGARNSMIFTLFFLESGFLGLVGGIVGVILGLIMAFGTAAAGRAALGSELIRANVSLTLILSALIGSIVVGMIAGLIPAIQASKKHPVDALRYSK